MPNHVHLIMAPTDPGSLAQAVGEVHRRYTWAVNRRKGWRGYLWQGRFSSFPMEEAHLNDATRYILLNPVRARLVSRAEDWPHSSALAHLAGVRDDLVDTEPLNRRISDWGQFLAAEQNEEETERFRSHQRTGRPMGSEEFLVGLEGVVGRRLRPAKPGRPKKQHQT
jgi:putative transposase